MTKTKKLTSLVAVGCAAVMALSGTFAWILQKDETQLNAFTHEIPDYGVQIVETFNPWVNKDVQVKSNGTSQSVIVRMRYEEFLSVDGKDADVEQQSGIYKATSLANVASPNGNDIRKDESSLAAKLTDLYFGERFISMAEWSALISGKTGAELTAVYDVGYWVIDTDGWCYYTKLLQSGDISNLSMSNALLNRTDEELADTYGPPININYNINVRVQAISADLSDYGATDNPEQWSCATTGRVIEDDTENAFEILTDTPNTVASDAIIRRISMINQLKSAVVGESVYLDGTEWTVISNDTTSSQTVVMARQPQLASNWSHGTTKESWENSLVKETLQTTYYNSLSDNIKGMIVPANLTYDALSGEPAVLTSTGNTVYMLSKSEIVNTLGTLPNYRELMTSASYAGASYNELLTRTLAADKTHIEAFLCENGSDYDRTSTTGYSYPVRPAMTLCYQ